MERMNTEYDLQVLSNMLYKLGEEHSSTSLAKVRDEINQLFVNSKCNSVYYTSNIDRLFFGIKVYPVFDGSKVIELLGDRELKNFDSYAIEFDSKLFDPILNLSGEELVSIIVYTIAHTVYGTEVLNEVKSAMDSFFIASDSYFDIRTSRGFRELLAYGIKDAISKSGSVFTKKDGSAVSADDVLTDYSLNIDMLNALKKIVTNISFMQKEVDDRFIVLSWVLRVGSEYNIMRIPAYKTLIKAAELTGSKLEENELKSAARAINNMDSVNEEAIEEGFFNDMKVRFSDAMLRFKRNGIKGIKNDVFELQLNLRAAEEVGDLMTIIRSANSKISILQDYLTEDISDAEREDVTQVLQTLYSIRQQAASTKEVKSRYSGYIQVTYPGIN